MSGRRTVLLVEDDRAFRTRFEAMLAADAQFEVLAAVETVAAGLRALRSKAPDLLVVDLGLPDGDGAELIRAAAALYPDCRAIVLSVFGDEVHVVRAIEAGANGYLLKDADAQELRGALHDVLAGGSPINPMVARLVLTRLRAQAAAAAPQGVADVALSEREAEILTLVAKGFSFPEICDLLTITLNTVKTHVNRAYRKLGVNSRGQAVHEATRLRLIDM